MPDWPIPSDERLTGTTDMGVMASPSMTGSLPEALQWIGQYLFGGVTPPGAASASGDVGQMLKQLAGGAFSKIPVAGESNAYTAYRPGYTSPAWGMRARLNGIESFGGGTTDVLSGSWGYSWDGTLHMWEMHDTGGSAVTYVSMGGDSNDQITPYGRNGKTPAFANLSGLILPPSTTAKFVAEFYGKWTANSVANRSFWGVANGTYTGLVYGLQTGGTPNNGVAFYRCATGWRIATCNGATYQETTEGADTSDSNYHLFRLEWDSNVRLYVDGTLKVTATLNVPLGSEYTGGGTINSLAVMHHTNDSDPMFYFTNAIAYWV